MDVGGLKRQPRVAIKSPALRKTLRAPLSLLSRSLPLLHSKRQSAATLAVCVYPGWHNNSVCHKWAAAYTVFESTLIYSRGSLLNPNHYIQPPRFLFLYVSLTALPDALFVRRITSLASLFQYVWTGLRRVRNAQWKFRREGNLEREKAFYFNVLRLFGTSLFNK